jgi:hypothetical protein
LVYESNPDKLEASYGVLLPLLVKSIQELSQEITDLKQQNQEFSQDITYLKNK